MSKNTIDTNLYEHFFEIDHGQEPLRIDKILMVELKMLQEIKFNKQLRKYFRK